MGNNATAAGRALFTFGIVADTHMNPRDGESSSPWTTNRLANERSTQVIEELNALDPDFVVHLGDIIHPVPASPGFAAAAARFNDLFSSLDADLHLVPGNHDVGDKPLEWMPAATIRSEYVQQYREHFGKDYFAFEHGGCGFVVINCQLLNSGLDEEREQASWLDGVLGGFAGKRIFAFSHYPPFIAFADETGHYDNLDEPGRSALLDLLDRHGVEALFTGHVHNFFYNRYRNLDIYVLPSLAFVRHDYSEMLHSPPVGEHGRDDRAKLGYMLVTVHERGHVPDVIRSYGRTPNDAGDHIENELAWPRLHVRRRTACPVGVDLRHAWCEFTAIPYTGAVDEFSRKWARNDYLLLGLWEAGIRRLRVPVGDLASTSTRERMQVLVDNGHEFTVFTPGIPDASVLDLARAHADLVDRWEVVLAEADWFDAVLASRELVELAGKPPCFSKLRTSAESATDGNRFNHFINHGFTTGEIAWLESRIAAASDDGRRPPGIVFRVGHDECPVEAVEKISGFAAAAGIEACVHVRCAHDNPGESGVGESGLVDRLCRATIAAWAFPAVNVFLDTFQAHDRGYFPRAGLLDRTCNPTTAGGAFRCFNRVLSAANGSGGREIRGPGSTGNTWLRAGDWSCCLLPDTGHRTLDAVPDVFGVGNREGEGILLQLSTGRSRSVEWSVASAGSGGIVFSGPVDVEGAAVFLPRRPE